MYDLGFERKNQEFTSHRSWNQRILKVKATL